MAEGVERLTGIRIRVGQTMNSFSYTVTNHRVKLIVHLADALSGTLTPGPRLVDARWVEPERLTDRTFSSVGRRVIAWINENPALVARQRPNFLESAPGEFSSG